MLTSIDPDCKLKITRHRGPKGTADADFVMPGFAGLTRIGRV
jgi:hypothetical protein